MSNQYRLLALLLILLTSLVACAGAEGRSTPESAPELTKMKVCMSGGSTIFFPIYAQEQGFFQKYGLDVELISTEGGATTVSGIVTGDCDLGIVGAPSIANAAAAGHDVILIAGLFNRQPYSLVVNPDITSGDDLRGKTVAAPRPGGTVDSVMRNAIRFLGLEPDVDVTILAIDGGQSNRLAAMEAGQVVATVLSVPESSRAKELGYHVLLEPSDLDIPYLNAGLAILRHKMQDNRPALKAFVQAIIEAGAQARQDREGVSAAIASVLELDRTTDAALIDDAYNQLVLEYLEVIPYPSRAGVQAALEEAARENEAAGSIDVDTLIDDSLLKELEEAGFIANFQEQ